MSKIKKKRTTESNSPFLSLDYKIVYCLKRKRERKKENEEGKTRERERKMERRKVRVSHKSRTVPLRLAHHIAFLEQIK